MPTSLAAAGAAFGPASTCIDSLNLLSAIQSNGASPRTEVVHMIDSEYNSAVCQQGHCGAGIRVGDYKILIGYPGDDIWEQPPASTLPVCSAALLNSSCMHRFLDQLANFSADSAAECCAACSKNSSCAGAFSYIGGNVAIDGGAADEGADEILSGVCYLKALHAKQTPRPSAL